VAQPNLMTFPVLTAAMKIVHRGQEKHLIEAIDDSISEAVRASHELAAKSSVTLTLTFSPEKKRVVVGAKLTTKKPEGGAVPLFGYVNDEGLLVEDDPEQGALPFTAPAGKGRGQG
jgi:hypothetical protein